MPLKLNADLPNGITFKNEAAKIVNLNNENFIKVKEAISQDPRFKLGLEDRVFDIHCELNGGNFPFDNKDAVLNVVIMIDIVNSTQKYQKGYINVLEKISEFICNNSNRFVQRLNAINTDTKLVDDMIDDVELKTNRNEPSICSKVCRYFSNKLYDNDAFYAWDSKVRYALPFYYKEYKGLLMQNKNWKKYSEFHDTIENFRKEICPNLTRLQIDQLLWFCHK